MNAGQEILNKKQPTGGLMSLEEMKLDNTDNDNSNFDPFYNPLSGGQSSSNGPQIELKA